MRDSLTWWTETKASTVKLESWLKDQYHGEVTAASRIAEIASKVKETRVAKILNVIADQEAKHARWVGQLLIARGLTPQVLQKEERYWNKTLPKDYADMPIEKLAAIGAHAEKMRLARIEVISKDQTAPEDIRETFKKILKDEIFHERAFREIAGDENMSQALKAHEDGLKALGLTV